MALLENMVGEGAEFKLVLEGTTPNIKRILNQTINDYITPDSIFRFALTRETNVNVFRFFRSYKPLGLKPEVFEFAVQSEELSKVYGIMLGFAIANLTPRNLTREEMNHYFRVCEKAILLRANKETIELIGNAVLSLKDLSNENAAPSEEVEKLKNSLMGANSLESIALVYSEIEKVNRIANPRHAAGTKTWHYSPLRA